MCLSLTAWHTRCAACCFVQADAITSIVKAAGIEVEPYWPALFAKLFANKSIGDLITNVGAGACLVRGVRCLHAS
jgi:ribosomal protein L12E/L44/L45/RPP1/RPP2